MPGQDRSFSSSNCDVSFTEEIRMMMYGLGDSSEPSVQTALLLEEIIRKQLLSIIVQAKDIASIANRDVIQPEDILFLMRKNIVGIKRLVSYLALKDEKQTLNKVVDNDKYNDKYNDDLINERMRDDNTWSPYSWKSSRKNYCLDQLRAIGTSEVDLESVEDFVKYNRLQRADHISQRLSDRDYENYHKARQASFGASQAKPKKFLQWLKEGGLTIVILPPVVEILVYLAKETLSQVIDMSLTLREQSRNRRYMFNAPPISVNEVREVVRRCWTPQSFTLGILTRDIPPYANNNLLAV